MYQGTAGGFPSMMGGFIVVRFDLKGAAFREAARYLISAAGIIVGISVLTVVLGLAEGGRSVLNDFFWKSGVRVYDIELSDKSLEGAGYLQLSDGRLLLDKMPEVKGSIPVLKLQAQLMSYKASGTALTLAVNEKYLQYTNLEMLKGSFINEQDVLHESRLAVIDDFTAIELFGTTEIIGQKLDMQVGGKKVEFTVSGVFRNFNRNIETLFEDEIPGLCFIPASVPEDVSYEHSVEKLVALVDKRLHKEEASSRLAHLLEKEHGAEGVYSINEYRQLPKVSEFVDKYLVFAVIVALVGLLSGSIGVMNAMLLSVQERKKEIGLYMFYGSGVNWLQYDIAFITLTVFILSGVLGLMLGLLLGSFIGGFVNINTGFSVLTVFIATSAPAFAGILSSLYPASKVRHIDVRKAIWGE